MFGITVDQFGGAVRWILTIAATLLTARGIVDESTAQAVVGGLVTVAVAIWSFWTNRPSKIADTETGVAKAPTPTQVNNLMSRPMPNPKR